MSMKWEVEDGEEERRGMEGEGSGVFMGEPEGGWLVSTHSAGSCQAGPTGNRQAEA